MNKNALREIGEEAAPVNFGDPYTLIPYFWIIRIREMNRSELSSKEQLYLDLFLFSTYTGGTTMTEMAFLKKDAISNRTLICDRIITSKTAIIPLVDRTKAIIKKYQMKCFGEYLLPVFTHKHQTPDQQASRIKRISEQTNRTLRKVCAQLGIKAEITLGSTRKIFITHMIDSRIPYEHIAEYVGCTIDTVIRHHEQFYQAAQEAWIQYSPDKK